MTGRPPICPIDEHELACHCGEDMESLWHDGHVATSMGCARCGRGQAELMGPWRGSEVDQ